MKLEASSSQSKCKAVRRVDFSLLHFLTWPKPSNTELPSVLLPGTSREDRHLSTHADIAVVWWASFGWSYRGKISNPK